MDSNTLAYLVVQSAIVAFMFGIVKNDTTWLKRKAEKDSEKFGAIFRGIEENKIGVAKNRTDIKNLKEDLKDVEKH